MIMEALSLAQLAYGAFMKNKGDVQQQEAESLAARNVRPEYKASGLYDDMLNMSVNQAQYGLDANALQFASDKINNSFTAGLSAMLQAGGNPNAVNSLYGNATDAFENLAVEDSAKKWQKVNAIGNAVDKLTEVKKDEFSYNEDGPYKDKARLAAQKQMMGYNQSMTGSDYMMGALSGLASHYGKKDGDGSTPSTPAAGGNPGFRTVDTTDIASGRNPVDLNNGIGPAFSTNWPGQTGSQFVSKSGDLITPGVASLSSMFKVPGANAGNKLPNSADALAALWSGRVKGYDANGNPIY